MPGKLVRNLFQPVSKYGVCATVALVDASKLPLEVLLLERNDVCFIVSNGQLGVSRTAFVELPDGLRVLVDEVVGSPLFEGKPVYQIELECSVHPTPDALEPLRGMSAAACVDHLLQALSILEDEVVLRCLDKDFYDNYLKQGFHEIEQVDKQDQPS